MTTRKLEVVVYRESDACVAQCLNINVASEGNTEEEALANLQEALELYFKDDEEAAVAPVTQAKLTQLTLRHA